MIEVKNVWKVFRLRSRGESTLKGTVLGLLKRKKKDKQLWALRDISFRVDRGKTLGIIGPNGAGKSTLLGLIAGTMRPTRGSIERRGKMSTLL